MASPERRYGMTIPFDGVPARGAPRLVQGVGRPRLHRRVVRRSQRCRRLHPLALAAAWAPELRLGTAIVPAFTRGPACLAQSVASLADAAPGRVAFGIGTSSNVIVERWNGIPFDEPYRQVSDMVTFLREALGGDKVTGTFGAARSRGFRLGLVPRRQPSILIAALRQGMLRLAGGHSDGAIINWLSADDVRRVVPIVAGAAREAGRPDPEVVARIFVAPTTDRDIVVGGDAWPSPHTSTCPCTRRSTSGWGEASCSRRCGACGVKAIARRPSRRSPSPWSTS
ncbi:MAG: LLM class flavin-dependent oxidoreductase [Microthrixaceae bacterium]|nr:LLM class flavin-dependent oxidoreductase [Microthrixaceae bacterium]